MNNEVFPLLHTRLMQVLILVRHANDRDMIPYQPVTICNRSSKSRGANGSSVVQRTKEWRVCVAEIHIEPN